MEYKKSDRTAYAYTLKLNIDKETTLMDYDPVFTAWTKYDCHIEYKCCENNKQKSGIHFHGIIWIPKGTYRKRLCPAGFHLKLVEIYNKRQWLKYIHKEQELTDEELIDIRKFPRLV